MLIEQNKTSEQNLVTKTDLGFVFIPLVWTVEYDVRTLVWTQSFLSFLSQTETEVFKNVQFRHKYFNNLVGEKKQKEKKKSAVSLNELYTIFISTHGLLPL